MDRRIANLLIALTMVVCPIVVGADSSGNGEPEPVPWSRLEYRGSKLMFSADSEIELERIPASETVTELTMPDPGPALMPKTDETMLVSLRTTGLGRESLLTLWLEPPGSALQRISTEVGKRYRYSAYRFAEDGVYQTRRYPAGKNEHALPPDEWSQGAETYQEYSEVCGNPCTVSTPAALFYLLAISPIRGPGDSVEFLVYTSKGLAKVGITAHKPDRIRANYVEESGHMERHIKESVDELHLKLRADSIDEDENANFRFLGLQDDIVLYFLPEQRLLVQIEGRVPKVGKVKIKLRRAIFD